MTERPVGGLDSAALLARLEDAAAALAAAQRALADPGLPDGAFGAAAAGLPGTLGRQLHERWTAGRCARADEAAAAALRLTELADAVRATAQRYADTDDLVRVRLRPESHQVRSPWTPRES
jgi:hypothetical protein